MRRGQREPTEAPFGDADRTLDTEIPNITYLDPETLTFSRSPGGLLRLTVPDRSYLQVTVTRTRPLSAPEAYLSIADGEKEIGILVDLTGLPDEQRGILADELARRYFQPVIRRVVELVEIGGTYHWEVETDLGAVKFDSQHPRHAVLRVSDERWLIRAADQNRFEIRDPEQLDRQSRKLLADVLI